MGDYVRGNSIVSASTNIQELPYKGRLIIMITLVKERKNLEGKDGGQVPSLVSLTYVMESN